MNKHLHQTIFNKSRGLLMVVAENVASAGKTISGSRAPTSPKGWATLRPACFAILIAFGSVASLTKGAHAQIASDPGAPASQRPTIVEAGNGVPIVNIQTPSIAGVSRNIYSQFDVQQQGAILNNARNNVGTQLGGQIQGNPWLSGGSARVILNEVNSSNPSLLHGYVEVAGDRAQVIIANPAGVSCDGCGFVNASRSTLTSGTPIINGGSLEGYRVRGGIVRITGGGLDNASADYTDIIARAVEVNAGIWAQGLNVITGSNDVSLDVSQVTKADASGAAPLFGIDVAQLGGMYAGKITLIGTEAGIGVRNAGSIGASTGEAVVTTDGRLENRGTLYAKGDFKATVHGNIDNTGTLASQNNMTLTANGGNLTNSGGLIGANGNLTLASTGLDNQDGKVHVQGNIDIQVGNGRVDNTAGEIVAGGPLAMQANSIDNRDGRIQADDTVAIASHGQIDNTRGKLVAKSGTLILQDSNQAAKALSVTNTGGTVFAARKLTIDSKHLSGDGALLSQDDIEISLVEDYTHSGTLSASGTASVKSAGVISNAALMEAGGDLRLKAATIDNQSAGELKADRLMLVATGANTFTNRGLIDGRDTVIESDTVNNLGTGRIYGDHVAIGAATLNNAAENGVGAVIAARNRLDIGAQTITNTAQATVVSGGSLVLGGALDGTSKHAYGQADTVLNRGRMIGANVLIQTSTSIVNSGPQALIGATATTGSLELYADDIQNRDDETTTDTAPGASIYGMGKVILAGSKNADGSLNAATTVLNQSALLYSGGDMAISAATLTNTRRVLTTTSTFASAEQSSGSVYWTSTTPNVPGGRYVEPPMAAR
ncbi:MAG: hypothetical protein C0489_09105 [Candidatus Accumulibacter sp.]|nr:hypothetical protein [Accumulibacter sp.]